MTRRVLMGANGFKVSRPGADVVTAGPADLWFNSDWGQLGLYSTGTILVNWSDPNYRYFSLGKSFPTPPVTVLQEEGATRSGSFDGYFAWAWQDNRGSGGSIEYNYREVYVAVQSSNFRIYCGYANGSGSDVHVPDLLLRYWIFDHNF